MKTFQIMTKRGVGHDMLIEFGTIEGMLAFVEEHGSIVISGTIESPFLELLSGYEVTIAINRKLNALKVVVEKLSYNVDWATKEAAEIVRDAIAALKEAWKEVKDGV